MIISIYKVLLAILKLELQAKLLLIHDLNYRIFRIHLFQEELGC